MKVITMIYFEEEVNDHFTRFFGESFDFDALFQKAKLNDRFLGCLLLKALIQPTIMDLVMDRALHDHYYAQMIRWIRTKLHM